MLMDIDSNARPYIKYVQWQVTKYTVREVLNHKRLVHPHIVEMREVG